MHESHLLYAGHRYLSFDFLGIKLQKILWARPRADGRGKNNSFDLMIRKEEVEECDAT
jgi:hypothetical protein